MPLGSSVPAGSAAGGTAQSCRAGPSKDAQGREQHADSLRGRLRQVLASATVQLPSQGPTRQRKAGSSAPSGGAGARVLEGRARLLVLAPRPDRPFSAEEPSAGLGDGVSTGSDAMLTAEEAAAARARRDASLGVGNPVSEAARRLGLELGGDLPMLAPADGGAPPIIPDTIGLLGFGGPTADGSPRPSTAFAASAEMYAERSEGASGGQGRGEGEGDEEEPLLGHAWETGRCFTIPMTVMYRISTDLGQVGLLPLPFAYSCNSAPVIVSALQKHVLQPGPGLHLLDAFCRTCSLACWHLWRKRAACVGCAADVIMLTSTHGGILHHRESTCFKPSQLV